MTKQEQIKEITEKLEAGIQALFQSEQYKNYLNTLSKFTGYSFNNSVLIAMQTGGAASLVAGYSTWATVGRHPRKGEKAIKIICPQARKKMIEQEKTDSNGALIVGSDGKPETEKVEKKYLTFGIGNVFDIAQTEGDPLPEIAVKVDGSVEGYKDFMRALSEVSPVPIEFQKIVGGANGYYSMADNDKKIVIEEDMSEAMHCKTGIHEIAHALLHDRETGLEKDHLPDSRTKEVQAESIAYTVSQYFGLDTSGYSFGYVAGWASGKDVKELSDSMEVIRKTSNELITGIEGKLKNIRLGREKSSKMEISEEQERFKLSIKR